MDAVKIAYKPVGLLLSAATGVVAGVLTKRVWRLAAGEPEPPKATEQARSWGEVLAAAALHGAVFALAKAAVDRAGATAVHRLTGTWPA
jgi:predicted metal-dependent enzyme (double-stranded beta helix superfamily)